MLWFSYTNFSPSICYIIDDNTNMLSILFLFSLVSFVEYLVGAGMSYPDEAVRASADLSTSLCRL